MSLDHRPPDTAARKGDRPPEISAAKITFWGAILAAMIPTFLYLLIGNLPQNLGPLPGPPSIPTGPHSSAKSGLACAIDQPDGQALVPPLVTVSGSIHGDLGLGSLWLFVRAPVGTALHGTHYRITQVSTDQGVFAIPGVGVGGPTNADARHEFRIQIVLADRGATDVINGIPEDAAGDHPIPNLPTGSSVLCERTVTRG